MDKREFIMSIARDLTVEIIRGDKRILECITRDEKEKVKKQVAIIKDLYQSMINEVNSIYTDTTIV